ncbi:hypothetical protein JKY72_03265 [Candidatus Gracilibacteria bacterium]|nr:hypothetical protein [Candidatus Gracilibacteria bacterium]
MVPALLILTSLACQQEDAAENVTEKAATDAARWAVTDAVTECGMKAMWEPNTGENEGTSVTFETDKSRKMVMACIRGKGGFNKASYGEGKCLVSPVTEFVGDRRVNIHFRSHCN